MGEGTDRRFFSFTFFFSYNCKEGAGMVGDGEEGGHTQEAAEGDVSAQQPADRSGAVAVAAKNPDKVMILAKNVANAPILKTTQFSASASHPFSKVIQHIQV
jgi:hypothetical protein